MNDWKAQLKELYGNHRGIQKSKKLIKEKSKFDSVVGWKNKKGFSSTGAALTAHAAKQQRKNKATYRYRYHGSRLEQINEQRAKDAAAKHSSSVQPDQVVVDKPIQDYRPRMNDHSSSSDSFFIGRVPAATGRGNQDDGSVELDPYAVEAAGASLINHEPTFKNKIDEDIWRLKNKK